MSVFSVILYEALELSQGLSDTEVEPSDNLANFNIQDHAEKMNDPRL